MRTRDASELLVLAALWGGSFLLMRIAAPLFGPVALFCPALLPAVRRATRRASAGSSIC